MAREGKQEKRGKGSEVRGKGMMKVIWMRMEKRTRVR